MTRVWERRPAEIGILRRFFLALLFLHRDVCASVPRPIPRAQVIAPAARSFVLRNFGTRSPCGSYQNVRAPESIISDSLRCRVSPEVIHAASGGHRGGGAYECAPPRIFLDRAKARGPKRRVREEKGDGRKPSRCAARQIAPRAGIKRARYRPRALIIVNASTPATTRTPGYRR